MEDGIKSVLFLTLTFLIKNFIFDDGIEKVVSRNLEDAIQNFNSHNFLDELKLTVIHETFIYYIALLLKFERYLSIGYVLSKTYFHKNYRNDQTVSFNIFYSRNNVLDGVMCRRDNKQYFCGTAQYWIENISVDYCTRNELIFADLIIYNFAVYSPKYTYYWHWFPVLYVYLERFTNPFGDYALKLVSKERFNDFNKMMSFENISQAKKIFKEIEDAYENGKTQRYRYNGAFAEAPLFSDYVKSEDLGKYE